MKKERMRKIEKVRTHDKAREKETERKRKRKR